MDNIIQQTCSKKLQEFAKKISEIEIKNINEMTEEVFEDAIKFAKEIVETKIKKDK